jgi:cytochrome o ubiquinol oxidase operon protein cyoD
MKQEKHIKKGEHGTFAGYLSGFLISIALTLTATIMVQIHVNAEHGIISHEVLLSSILGFAFIQLFVQLYFFLHMSSESGPRWKLGILVSTIGLVLLIVVASLWIMNHLNYNMDPQQMQQYLIDQSG